MHFVARERLPARNAVGARACERRGYCGPFLNEAYYDAFPEPLWHGMGDCAQCGTTRKVGRERPRTGALEAAA
jgi:hypothetical protein